MILFYHYSNFIEFHFNELLLIVGEIINNIFILALRNEEFGSKNVSYDLMLLKILRKF